MDIDMNIDKIMDTKIDRVQQMIKVQNEALELFRKKILIMAMHLLNMVLLVFL